MTTPDLAEARDTAVRMDCLAERLSDSADTYLDLRRAGDTLRALADEVERLRGLKPELPPRPDHNNDASYQHPSLPRYGLRWNGPGQPVAVSMADGYWTPFHLALRAAAPVQQPESQALVDNMCALSVWWTHNRARVTTPKQAAFAAWNDSFKRLRGA